MTPRKANGAYLVNFVSGGCDVMPQRDCPWPGQINHCNASYEIEIAEEHSFLRASSLRMTCADN